MGSRLDVSLLTMYDSSRGPQSCRCHQDTIRRLTAPKSQMPIFACKQIASHQYRPPLRPSCSIHERPRAANAGITFCARRRMAPQDRFQISSSWNILLCVEIAIATPAIPRCQDTISCWFYEGLRLTILPQNMLRMALLKDYDAVFLLLPCSYHCIHYANI